MVPLVVPSSVLLRGSFSPPQGVHLTQSLLWRHQLPTAAQSRSWKSSFCPISSCSTSNHQVLSALPPKVLDANTPLPPLPPPEFTAALCLARLPSAPIQLISQTPDLMLLKLFSNCSQCDLSVSNSDDVTFYSHCSVALRIKFKLPQPGVTQSCLLQAPLLAAA